MLYDLYELNHAAMAPFRAATEMGLKFWKAPGNPWASSAVARAHSAALEMFERATRRFGKPAFEIHETEVQGAKVRVEEQPMLQKPFCNLLHFRKIWTDGVAFKPQEKVLLVAPMSGHYATLLRNTVEALLPLYDVYVTDWIDARNVPITQGKFDLEDYTDYVIEMIELLGPGTTVIAVCQPSVPVMAAVSLMNANKDPATPKAMVLMGGPIDTRRNPTAVNKLAEQKGVEWFRKNVTMRVPFPHTGFMRQVYPGFLQLTGFMTMNLDRHVDAHRELFWHLVEGDQESAERRTEFYDEYMSVMDLTAEFYLMTIDKVFVNHDLPNGTFMHRGQQVDPSKITNTALLTIEGEKDDITSVGQTEAAQDLCSALPDKMKKHYVQLGVGHYGVFSGSRFRKEVVPVISNFIAAQE